MDDTQFLEQVRGALTFGLDGKPPEEVGRAPETVGQIQDMDAFTKARLKPLEDFKASAEGENKVHLPEGYGQLREAMKIVTQDIARDQGAVMAKYGEIRVSVRQSMAAPVGREQGEWHIEPDRNPDSVDHDTQYLMSDIDGTLVQTMPVKADSPDRTDPSRNSVAGTFNRMRTNILVDAGVARQGEPGEILKLNQTAHAIAETTSPERTMVRVTFVPPTEETLRNIPESEQQQLPQHVQDKIGLS